MGESDERRGTSFSTQSDASLDLRTTEYLNYSIFNILARKGSVSVRKGPANSLKERQPCKQPSCKCCYEWSTVNSIPLEVQPGAGSPGPLPTPQSSLFLQKLHQLAPLMDGTADCGQEKAEQTVEQGDLPKWNLLTHDLLHAWSLSSQVCSLVREADFTCHNEFYYPPPG